MSTKDAKTKSENAIARHPLVIVVVSFLLSGVLVTFLGQWIAYQMRVGEQVRSAIEHRKVGIHNLSRYIYERRTRAAMLRSAIIRDAQIDEIKERKKSYDEAFVRWNSDILANSFMIREIDGPAYSFIEGAVQVFLVEKWFTPLDRCLTRAFDEVVSGRSGLRILEECGAEILLKGSLTCGYVISNEMYLLSSGSTTKRQACETVARVCTENDLFDKNLCR